MEIMTIAQTIKSNHKGVDVRIAARHLSKEYRFNWDEGEEEYTFADQSKIVFFHHENHTKAY